MAIKNKKESLKIKKKCKQVGMACMSSRPRAKVKKIKGKTKL